jgi:hypothetical protein
MLITGSSSFRRLEGVAIVMDLHELAPVGGRPRAGETGGGSSGSPRCVRIFRIGQALV